MKLSRNFPILLSLVALLAIALAGCGHSVRMLEMDKAELLMDSHPDSSLNILSTIPRKELRGDKEKARHALLTVMAKDKCYLPLDRDSDFLRAADYYRVSGPDSLLLRASYYLGRIHFDRQEYPSAILSFFQAKDIADKNKDYFWAGMASRGISDVYNETYNASEELRYAREELDNFQKSGRQPYIDYAMLDLARALNTTGDFYKSLETLKQICDSATIHKDLYLSHASKSLIGLNYLRLGRHEEAKKILLQLLASQFSSKEDSVLYAYSLMTNGETEKTGDIIKHLTPIKDRKLTIIRADWLYKRGKAKEAYDSLKSFQSQYNSEFWERLGLSINGTLIDFLDLKVSTEKQHNKLLKRNLILILIFLFLLISGGLYSFLSYKKRKEVEISNKILLAENLHASLAKFQEENHKSASSLKHLLVSKYKVFEDLCYTLATNNKGTAYKKQLADQFTALINKLSNDPNTISSLIEDVNVSYNNIFNEFKNSFPNLKEIDYKIFLYSLVGFSSSVISMLINEPKISSIYERKRRIKDKIKTLPEDKRRAFDPFLS